MTRSKIALLFTMLSSIFVLAVAVFLQLTKDMLPCPLCVMQRYAFAAIAIFCLLALLLPAVLKRIALALGLLSTLAGAGVAGYHLWILANPAISCGIDPLETGLNKIFIANLLPTLFQANGLCDTPYEPLFGLSMPAWAMVWFVIFTIIFSVLFFTKKKARGLFGKSH
jgi:disulfide bond formation protein DsbB